MKSKDPVDVMIHRWGQSCRERDQARDALADLLLALDDPDPRGHYTPALVAAMQQARTVLRGREGRDGNAGD